MQITSNQKSMFFQIIGSFSLALLVISLSVHLSTFWNVNLEERFPYISLLHIGIFAFIFPIFSLQKIEEKQDDEKIFSLQDGFDELEKSKSKPEDKSVVPKWLIVTCCLVGFYAMVNFFIFGLGANGSPEIKNDKYVLSNHGQIVKELSKDEYDVASAQSLRGFSGHWIIFYFYFTAVAFLQVKEQKEK